jgi:hypothetical protein
MNFYNELLELEELKEKSKIQKDDILDLFYKNPIKAKKLMLEVMSIDKELNELEEEFKKIQNEIY